MARLRRRLERAMNVRVKSRSGEKINDIAMLVTGASIGAMSMYMLDSNSGRRRRAMARDKMLHWVKLLGRSARGRAQDLRNRAIGSFMETRSRRRDAMWQVDDSVLEGRVRAQLGHVLTDPGRVEVFSQNGCVIISGPVLAGEREKILHRLRKTRGVRDFDLRVSERESGSEGSLFGRGESRSERTGVA